LAMLLLASRHRQKYYPYLAVYLAVLVIHTLIPHKEYRFIFLLIPLGLALIPSLLTQTLTSFGHRRPLMNQRIAMVIIGVVSILGIFDKLPFESSIYAQPPLMRDPVLDYLVQLSSNPAVCSVYTPDRDWVFAGSYLFLHQYFPLYSHDYGPPPAYLPSHLILPNHVPPPPGYRLLSQSKPYTLYIGGQPTRSNGYSLYQMIGPCQKISAFSDTRSFDFLQPILQPFKPYYD